MFLTKKKRSVDDENLLTLRLDVQKQLLVDVLQNMCS